MDLNFLREALLLFLILVASLSVHEWAHAFVADKLGDHTPRSHGRVTLNPASHFDPIGTGLIPLMNIMGLFGGLALIGWGRPVMINRNNFENRVFGDILVSMAGPFSNLVIALGAAILGGFLRRISPEVDELIFRVIWMNVGLAVFNLVPIPPLDGSHVMRHAIGMSEENYINISRWSGLILLVLINLPFFRHLLTSMIRAVSGPYFWLYGMLAT